MNPIVWLASYPKSGNTWFRAFLANLLSEADASVDINELRTGTISSARDQFDIHTGLEASDLTHDEVDLLRPGVYRRMAATASAVGHHKVHDALTVTCAGEPLFPADATAGAVYLIRNPLDVAPSYAHHSANDIDWAVRTLGDPDHHLVGAPKRLHVQLRQKLGTWSQHVLSWADGADFPVEVIRYEDLHCAPEDTFARAARFMNIDTDAAAIRRAIDHSSFEVLRAQEQAKGFAEKNPRAASFFRTGRVGSWRRELSDAQAARIIADHADVMQRFGYLVDGEPVE